MKKEFNLVLCDDEDFRKFYKKSPKIDIINHNEIIVKLENNDIYKNKPTQDILKFFIITRIKKSINSQKIESIFYKVDEINSDIISSMKLVLGAYFNKVELNLILHESVYIDDIKDNFNEIIIIK